MSERALYLGGHCPPNMEAYLDSLLYRTMEEGCKYDLVVVGGCNVPAWLTDTDRLSLVRYDVDEGSGLQRLRTAVSVIRRYVESHDPDAVRQITQPRWHAPGVLLGAAKSEVAVWSRASASLFNEYQAAPAPVKAWLVNNGLGKAIFLADRLFTPRYGGVNHPWWSRAELVHEKRVVNANRFSPDATPRSDLFDQADRRVLTIGRISRRKGTDRLLDVADMLPEHEFVVVGPVQDEALAAAVDDSSNLTREPPVEYVKMPELYAASDVVLSVSQLEWGGVSRAMLEGKATGRCVVALDREEAYRVADEVTSDDPSEIAAAVRRCTD